MPEFIRPKRAIIETDDAGWLALLCLLAAVAFGVALVAAVYTYVAAHLVLLSCCFLVFCGTVGGFAYWSRWATSPRRRLAARQAAEWRERVEAAPAAREIPADHMPAPRRAAWPRIDTGYAEAVRQSPSSAHGKEV